MTNPTELADAIDAMFAIDVQIATHEATINQLKAQRRGLELQVMQLLSEGSLSVAGGSLARATLHNKEVFNAAPGPDGWTKIYERIRDTGEFELLHKALTQKACKERFDAGDIIPGVERRQVPVLTVKPII
jgi:hypothetical protein